jgi:hypothetical protein
METWRYRETERLIDEGMERQIDGQQRDREKGKQICREREVKKHREMERWRDGKMDIRSDGEQRGRDAEKHRRRGRGSNRPRDR